jgi:hypothetical protein
MFKSFLSFSSLVVLQVDVCLSNTATSSGREQTSRDDEDVKQKRVCRTHEFVQPMLQSVRMTSVKKFTAKHHSLQMVS